MLFSLIILNREISKIKSSVLLDVLLIRTTQTADDDENVVACRCVVPECEYADSSFNASWTAFAIANNTHTCHRPRPFTDIYNRTLHSNLTSQLWDVRNPLVGSETCSPEYFSTNKSIPCDTVVYENYNSIAAEV